MYVFERLMRRIADSAGQAASLPGINYTIKKSRDMSLVHDL